MVRIFQSETRLVDFLMNDNVNLMVEMYRLTLLTSLIIFRTLLGKKSDVYVKPENGRHNYTMCNLMEKKYNIQNDPMGLSFISKI